MIEQLKGKSDGVEMGLLLAGIVTVLVAYFLPAVTFSGQRGAAVYGLSIFSKLPIMSALAVAAMVAALAMTPIVVGAVVALNGACWITVIANNGTSVQMILPNYMRARGMAVHQMVFFGAMVLGALLWGKIANFFDVRTALIGSAVMLVPLTVLAASIKLPGSSVPRV